MVSNPKLNSISNNIATVINYKFQVVNWLIKCSFNKKVVTYQPKSAYRLLKRVQTSKIETIGNANLLATTVNDIGLQTSIDYAKHKAS